MIDAVLATIKITPWRVNYTQGGYVSQGWIQYQACTAGGRWLFLQGASICTISQQELARNPAPAMEAHKRDVLTFSLETLLKRQLTIRQGLRGYRGRFRLVALRPIAPAAPSP